MTFHVGKSGTDTSIDHLILTFLFFLLSYISCLNILKVESEEPGDVNVQIFRCRYSAAFQPRGTLSSTHLGVYQSSSTVLFIPGKKGLLLWRV